MAFPCLCYHGYQGCHANSSELQFAVSVIKLNVIRFLFKMVYGIELNNNKKRTTIKPGYPTDVPWLSLC